MEVFTKGPKLNQFQKARYVSLLSVLWEQTQFFGDSFTLLKWYWENNTKSGYLTNTDKSFLKNALFSLLKETTQWELLLVFVDDQPDTIDVHQVIVKLDDIEFDELPHVVFDLVNQLSTEQGYFLYYLFPGENADLDQIFDTVYQNLMESDYLDQVKKPFTLDHFTFKG